MQKLSPLLVFLAQASHATLWEVMLISFLSFFSLYFKLHSRETLWRALEDLFPKFPRCEDSSYSRAPSQDEMPTTRLAAVHKRGLDDGFFQDAQALSNASACQDFHVP